MPKEAGGVPARVLLIGCNHSLLTTKGRARRYRLMASDRTGRADQEPTQPNFLDYCGTEKHELGEDQFELR
jgi:hypothetical protein